MEKSKEQHEDLIESINTIKKVSGEFEKIFKEINKMSCKEHKLSFSTKEKAQILVDNLRIPAKRTIKKCHGCGRFYVKTKFFKPI